MRLVLFALLVACNRGKDAPADLDTTPPDGDTDTDADSDSDTDADADADADADSDADTDADADPNVVEDCANVLTAPPAGEVCGVSGDPATATHILIAGDILGDDKSWLTGQILIERATNGTITCVGCGCDAEAPAETLIVSCPDAVVSPGLINSHDHIRYNLEAPGNWGTERFDHRHDWRTGARGHTEIDAFDSDLPEAVTYGELRMMLGGATSITGSLSSTPGTGLMRDLDVSEYNEGLGGWEVGYETFPLGDSDGTLAASGCDQYFPDQDYVLEDRIYLPHIAEGIDDEANNEFRCLSGVEPGGVDLLERNTAMVHGIGLDASDVTLVAEAGAKLVWSPRSNISLYGETAPVTLYDNLGVTIALGTDWTPSGSATMLRELQCADSLNRDHYGNHFSDRDLWLMVTRNAAVAMGGDGQIGRLREGFIGDVAVFAKNGNTLHRAVIDAGIQDVALVLRGSKPLTGDADLMAGLVPAADFGACETLDDCVSDHVVCMDSDKTLAEVIAAVGPSAYDLTICAAPADEPSCVPLRDDEDGDGLIYPTSSLTDLDQDGVDDADDNCVDVFNPGKPLDGFVQGDVDADGVGDACDSCPLDAAGGCNWLDPDNDGIRGLDDNCADVANSTQDDTDGDLLGDACDACPEYRSPTGACPESIYDLKQGLLVEGSSVVLEHMLVTAVSGTGVFLQLDPNDPTFVNEDFSGIQVYAPSIDPTPARGDIITIESAFHDFFGQLQLDAVSSWSLESAGNADPAPVVVSADEVATGAARADALESVVVRVDDVTVTAVDLAPGAGDTAPTHEFELDGALRVNDFLTTLEPAPVVGENFSAISGVLRYANGNSKLEPRDALDVLSGEASIAALVPDTVVLEAGVIDDTLLVVTLARPAGVQETVTLTCAPAQTLTCPASVTIDVGEQEAAIELTGVAASGNAATVTATLNSSVAEASVVVYDDASVRSVVSLDPNPLGIAPDSVGSLTVTLDLPAATGGTVVDLAAASGFVSVPLTVTVDAGAFDATFDVTAGPADGVDLVTATLGASSTDTVVNVDAAAVGIGLLFSEYLEGSVGNNKFVEIKNVDAGSIDLTGCTVSVYSNGAVVGSAIALDPVVLASGDLFLLCHNATTFATFAPCDQTNGSLTFNGDDAVELACGATVYDVIGQIGVDPGDFWGVAPEITKDGVLRRDCTVAQGDADGSDVFDPAAEWLGGAVDDSSDLGNDSCP